MPPRRTPLHLPLRSHSAALAVLILLAGAAAGEAQAKKKAKEPVYVGSITASGDWNYTSDCDYSSHLAFQCQGKYYATGLDETATLDARREDENRRRKPRLDLQLQRRGDYGPAVRELRARV